MPSNTVENRKLKQIESRSDIKDPASFDGAEIHLWYDLSRVKGSKIINLRFYILLFSFSPVLRPPLSVICRLPFVFRYPSSVIFRLPSVHHHPSSVFSTPQQTATSDNVFSIIKIAYLSYTNKVLILDEFIYKKRAFIWIYDQFMPIYVHFLTFLTCLSYPSPAYWHTNTHF